MFFASSSHTAPSLKLTHVAEAGGGLLPLVFITPSAAITGVPSHTSSTIKKKEEKPFLTFFPSPTSLSLSSVFAVVVLPFRFPITLLYCALSFYWLNKYVLNLNTHVYPMMPGLHFL